MKILFIIPSFYPAVKFGGPIFSRLGLCRGLERTGRVNFKVLTTDVAGKRLRQKVNPVEAAKMVRRYNVQYCRRIAGHSISLELLLCLIPRIQWADLVHLSAVYSFPTIPTLAVARRFGKPVVWSPHGALQQWEGNTKFRLKKYWNNICNVFMVAKKTCLQVTSKEEKIGAQKIFPAQWCEVIPNGVDIPKIGRRLSNSGNNVLKLLFMGRIHPSKGLDNLLKALAAINHDNWELNIFGSGESRYRRSMIKLCRELRLETRVNFTGHVSGKEKYEAYTTSDVCVVPSHTENFGNVVAEALAHGVPVIASTGTPWSAIEQKGCGIWTPNDPAVLAEAIKQMETRDLDAMGAKGRVWMQHDFSWDRISNRMLALYGRVVEGVRR